MEAAFEALYELGRFLRDADYRFVSVTPATHARVQENALRRGRTHARTLRDVFGWNLPFEPDDLPRVVLDALQAAGACQQTESGLRATVRFATLGDELFVHSGHPTLDKDAVFFGPDTVRFCAALRRWLAADSRVYERMVDVGCGSGAGGIIARPYARELVLADINTRALRFAEVNAALAGASAVTRRSDILAQVDGPIDAVLANPPYLIDDRARVYRDGGGRYGEGLSLRIVEESLARLQPGGLLILYTGTAVVDGTDVFRRAVEPLLSEASERWQYEEIDPDVFGEELALEPYAEVERLAAVALRAIKR